MLHEPVLLNHFTDFLKTMPIEVGFFLDGTFGRGGHTRAVLKNCLKAKIIALDKDQQAINYGKEEFKVESDNGKIFFIKSGFENISASQIDPLLKGEKFSGILLDLGVSSPQLDNSERGFSFYKNGPLDMRMDQSQTLMARDILNSWSEDELIELFKDYGEVRRPRHVVRAVVEDRKKKNFEFTRDFSGLIERVDGWSKKKKHPATQYFLALRIEVNKELEVVSQSIPQMIELLKEGGRLFVISFHSLEDRIVKYSFKDQEDNGIILTKKVIQASFEEKKKNPRARSAKLRIFQKGKLS